MMDTAHRILVVDDNLTNTVLLDKALRKAGYDVLVACDGFKAVEMAETEKPDIILLDMMMPQRDGLETCEILKSRESTAAIPIIFVTALAESGSVVAALSAGGCDYVTKPFRIEEVLARVSVHLRLADAESDLAREHAQLERLAKQLASVNEELAQQARVDPLTKLLNRRAWVESAELEHDRSHRLEHTYAVVMIDLDHFKALNDSQGHAAGDACLGRLAGCITSACRTIDFVGRYGGEEFIVLCPETDETGALRLAERLRSAIWDLAIPHPAAETASRVTASLGVATSDLRPLEATIKAADEAMYRAKESGRNQVCGCEDASSTKGNRSVETTLSVPAAHIEEGSDDSPIVLIVDDEPTNRMVCSRCLSRDGYQIREAIDGVAALAEVEREAPDVIIMDLKMPNMGGLECTKRLKSDPETWDIPIIMVSARADHADVLAGLEAGAEEYLPKPIRTAELALRVRSMVRLRRKHKELLHSYRLRGEQTLFLSTLLDLCHSLGTTSELDTAFERVIQTTAELSTSRRISIMMPDTTRQHLTIVASIGIDPETAASIRVPIGDGIAGQVFKTGHAKVVNSEHEGAPEKGGYDTPFFASIPLVCAPVGVGGEILGVLNVTERLAGRPFEPQELEYINLLASIAGSTIHGIMSSLEREAARDAIVVALARLAEHRDNETGLHVERVTRYCLLLARQLRTNDKFRSEIDDEFLYNLERVAPLHDIGKVAIDDSILRKPGKLTPKEVAIMQTHAQAGAETIETAIRHAPGSAFLEMAQQIAIGHHEWYDGSGYPAGLKANAIPLSARIVAVADVYDALNSERVYKAAMSHEQSSAIIAESSGTHFDPAVVEAFLECEEEFAALGQALSDDVAPTSLKPLEASRVGAV